MTSRKDVESQYITWNFAGAGSDRLTGGNWRFNRRNLYYQDVPYKRVLIDTKGVPLQLVRESHLASIKAEPTELISSKAGGIRYRSWVVPTIGILSRFDGDELSLAELHERQKFLMIAEVRALIPEMVNVISGADLYKKDGSLIINRASNMYARYFNYGLVFGTKWGEMPRMYMEEIKSMIRGKIDRYHDPKAVAQRERSHARKIAKQAFGLS